MQRSSIIKGPCYALQFVTELVLDHSETLPEGFRHGSGRNGFLISAFGFTQLEKKWIDLDPIG